MVCLQLNRHLCLPTLFSNLRLEESYCQRGHRVSCPCRAWEAERVSLFRFRVLQLLLLLFLCPVASPVSRLFFFIFCSWKVRFSFFTSLHVFHVFMFTFFHLFNFSIYSFVLFIVVLFFIFPFFTCSCVHSFIFHSFFVHFSILFIFSLCSFVHFFILFIFFMFSFCSFCSFFIFSFVHVFFFFFVLFFWIDPRTPKVILHPVVSSVNVRCSLTLRRLYS